MTSNKNIIIANWKMNQSFDEIESWLESFNENINNNIKEEQDLPEIVVCPPSILIDYLDELMLSHELDVLEDSGENIEELEEEEIESLTSEIRNINIGGQDCSGKESGAFTGDVSAKMLKDAGCKYVIVGHSERRQNHFESNENVKEKILEALKNQLIPVLCIGESLELREGNKYQEFIKKQLDESIPKNIKIEDLIIAYEPIWSIGTGKIPSKDQISEMVDFIKNEVEKDKEVKINGLRILYGGSTNKENTAEIMSVKNVSGLLVGGASLKPEEFASMTLLSS